jgi:hypothetical protein
MDSLVYAVFNQEGKILVLKQYEIEATNQNINGLAKSFQSIFEQDELLKFLYRKCHIAFGNNLVALVPERLFNSKKAATYLHEVASIDKASNIDFNEVASLKTMVVYEQQSAIQKIVKARQPSSRIFHRTTPFLTGCSKKAATAKEKVVYANFQLNNLEICLFNNNQLHFYNNFEYQFAADCLYFVLLIFEQFNLDPNLVKLHLAGQILENSEIYKSLYRYVRNIAFITPPAGIQLNASFKNVPTHYYFNLFSLKLL